MKPADVLASAPSVETQQRQGEKNVDHAQRTGISDRRRIAMYDGLGIQLPTDNEQAQVDVVDAAVNSLEYDGWHNMQYTICSPSDQVKAFAKVMTECVADAKLQQ